MASPGLYFTLTERPFTCRHIDCAHIYGNEVRHHIVAMLSMFTTWQARPAALSAEEHAVLFSLKQTCKHHQLWVEAWSLANIMPELPCPHACCQP